jgi:hypothetical protein
MKVLVNGTRWTFGTLASLKRWGNKELTQIPGRNRKNQQANHTEGDQDQP